jgi:hypothetical protein
MMRFLTTTISLKRTFYFAPISNPPTSHNLPSSLIRLSVLYNPSLPSPCSSDLADPWSSRLLSIPSTFDVAPSSDFSNRSCAYFYAWRRLLRRRMQHISSARESTEMGITIPRAMARTDSLLLLPDSVLGVEEACTAETEAFILREPVDIVFAAEMLDVNMEDVTVGVVVSEPQTVPVAHSANMAIVAESTVDVDDTLI